MEFILPGGEGSPPAKETARGAIVRLARDPVGKHSRYASLSTVIASTEHIWAGVLASTAGDGWAIGLLKSKGAHTAATADWREERGGVCLSLVDLACNAVIVSGADVSALASVIDEGARVLNAGRNS